MGVWRGCWGHWWDPPRGFRGRRPGCCPTPVGEKRPTSPAGVPAAPRPHAWPLPSPRPVAMLAVWSSSGPGSDARHEGSSHHPRRGQDHWEAVSGAHFPGDRPHKWLALCGGGGVVPAAPRPGAPSVASTRFSLPACSPRCQAMGSVAGPWRATGWWFPSLVILQQCCKKMHQILLDTKENK